MRKKVTKLGLYRQELDKIDNQIIKLLAKRFTFTKRIALCKEQNGLKIVQKQREAKIFKNRLNQAKKLRINTGFIKAVFQIIIRQSREEQLLLTKKPKTDRIKGKH